MGAVTVSVKKRNYFGASKVCIADVTFSGTYGAGGDTYTNAQFEMDTIDAIIDQGAAAGSATTGYLLSPDLANKKLRLLSMGATATTTTPLAETTTGVQTGTVQRVLVIGNQPNI